MKAGRARRRPAAADGNAEALLWRRGAGSCTRQIDLFCAPQLMSTEVPRSAQIGGSRVISRLTLRDFGSAWLAAA